MRTKKHGRVLGIVLAGGKGTRLMPLTKYRAKPAVHFAGKYRIIDFALSNLINSGIYSVYVLIQFKSQSLTEHIERSWQFGGAMRGRDLFVTLAPAQMWSGEHWFQGTADAVFQNIHLITKYDADRLCIFAADHIYKMDVRQVLDYHIDKKADITVTANVVPTSEASQFGCLAVDTEGRITGFVEKPADPPEIPGKPGFSYVSMGNYIFEREILEKTVIEDAHDPGSSHDFGKDIFPKWHDKCRIFAYDFSSNQLPGKDQPYWKDVGTLKAYWETHMDLLQHNSKMTLYNPDWPIRTVSYADPPSYFYPVKGQTCSVMGTLASEGSRVFGAVVHRSVLSRNCVIHPRSVVEECIIGHDVVINEGCKLRRVIVDSNNVIPPNTVIGYDRDYDRERYHLDESSGIVVIAKPPIQLRSDMDPSLVGEKGS